MPSPRTEPHKALGTPPAPAPLLRAPASWQRVEFISDLHLSEREPATWQAWLRYLSTTRADALFILGDLFEVWVGDDAASEPGFEAECTEALRTTCGARPVFVMHGNRDFLLGPQWFNRTGAQWLTDPTVLDFNGQRWLLSHGDALCLEDHDYQAFRAQVRRADWQHAFLAQALSQRRQLARGMRDASEARKRSTDLWADVDTAAARAQLQQAQCHTLIHGHTHRPGEHALGDGLRRVVLSDWCLDAAPMRAEVLVLDRDGLHRQPLATA